MTVKMDKMSAPSSREFAQRLYDKNIELENRRRKSAQARIPSDPNAWQQMRENYEAIILEDHAFSEQHNIEYALWQLHYRRIEEFRAHFNAALASSGSNTSQGVKGSSRPDRITKIRLQFKTFLSEATGFYHDLVLKVRAKYGLPLGSFSEDSEHQAGVEKSGKKSAEVKKGLISCHRCLIYLGDLARYKGLYGEGDSKSRDYAAASSYYLQATSLWPSSGNPHHQLAILASYDGDELVAVYRYFRSLAVDFPFSTARDNLIVAFEKNRQSYSQLHVDAKASAPKESRMWITGKGRGKKETKLPYKDTNAEVSIAGVTSSSVQDIYKVFCIKFVRLNGILFTRTSLETFEEVLSSVVNGLLEILSTGTEEELSFGGDAVENGLVIVRLISILIFTVHNLNRQSEGQTYAEILQRNVLLQNAFAAVFEFMAKILNRCAQLRDPSSSYLLPGILIFLEWLACCPDVAVGSEGDEKQASVRSVFWNQYVSFLNKLTSNGSVSVDDEDETCFFNMSSYEEGETENRLVLWEDFELRGFLPLLPAQTILDFSRQHSFASDGNKEKLARVKRVLAAGKALKNIVRVGPKTIYFDPNVKKFAIGIEPQKSDNFTGIDSLGMPNSDGLLQENHAEETINSGISQSKTQLIVEGEDEEEVIVFKPTVFEKPINSTSHSWMAHNSLETGKSISAGDSLFYGGGVSAPVVDFHQQTAFRQGLRPPVTVPQITPQQLPQQQQILANGLKCLNIGESTQSRMPEMQQRMDVSHADSVLLGTIQQPLGSNINGLSYGQTRASETVVPSKFESAVFPGVKTNSLVGNTSSTFPSTSRIPVSRPVRHLGPPPGFGRAAPKQVNGPISGSDVTCENPLMDDYSWLDGYQLPASLKGSGLQNSIDYVSNANSEFISKSNGITGTMGFPFPGKQVPTVQSQAEKQKLRQDHPIENLKLHREQQLQHHQQLASGNQQFTPLSEQYQGPSIWTGQYFV